MQAQSQRTWWPAWTLTSSADGTRLSGQTSARREFEQSARQAPAISESTSISTPAPHLEAVLSQEVQKKLAVSQSNLSNAEPQHSTDKITVDLTDSADVAKSIRALLLSLPPQPACGRMQALRCEAASPTQHLQQFHGQHHSHLQANSSAAESTAIITASSSAAVPNHHHSIPGRTLPHSYRFPQQAQVEKQRHQQQSGCCKEPCDQHALLQASLATDKSSALSSAANRLASTATLAKGCLPEHAALVLRPHTISSCSSSRVVSKLSQIQNLDRASSIFEPGDQSIVHSSSDGQPSSSNVSLRAEFLSVISNVGKASQPPTPVSLRMPALSAQPVYDSSIDLRHCEVTSLPTADLQAARRSSGQTSRPTPPVSKSAEQVSKALQFPVTLKQIFGHAAVRQTTKHKSGILDAGKPHPKVIPCLDCQARLCAPQSVT